MSGCSSFKFFFKDCCNTVASTTGRSTESTASLNMPGGLGFKNPRLYKICELQEIINYQDDIFVRGGFTAQTLYGLYPFTCPFSTFLL